MRKKFFISIAFIIFLILIIFIKVAKVFPFSTGDSLYTGLVSYWKMDEGSGTNVADSIGTNNGTATGTTIVAGKSGLGNARSLNGTGDYINMGNIPLPTGSITLEAWIKPSVVNTYLRIIDRTNGGATGTSMLINNDGRIRYQLKTAVMTELYSNTYLQANTWYHVVGTYDGNYMRIYLNGVQDNIVAKTGTISYDNINTYIGAYSYSSPGQFFNGIIDEVGIWNKALIQTEITNLYNSGLGNTFTSPTPTPTPAPTSSPTPTPTPAPCYFSAEM